MGKAQGERLRFGIWASLAILNDVKVHELTNATVEDFLKGEERVKALVKRLKI